ncbi:MAG: diacylglycerol kinase family lipid kinase [bacterium]|nr:diacylglycerol kinase family lipid kinase [bacterium]
MHSQKKTLLVLNPAAGKGTGKKTFANILSGLESHFQNLDTVTSQHGGHLHEIGSDAVRNGYDLVISIGGDGTPFELINGIYAQGKPRREILLGMIPAGTGNSFLRDFAGVSQQTWMDAIVNGQHREGDMVEFLCHHKGKEIKKYFLNIMGIGLIADVLKLTNEKLKFLGAFGYNAAVLIRLFKSMKNKITAKVDGKEYHFPNSALVISNSKYTGGEMKIAPMAKTDDGKVDIVVFSNVNRREILAIFLAVFKGKHVQHPKVEIVSGSQIELTAEPGQLLMADGELLGETPMKLKVLHKELKILMPPH